VGGGELLIVSAFKTQNVDTPDHWYAGLLIENLSNFQRQKVSDSS